MMNLTDRIKGYGRSARAFGLGLVLAVPFYDAFGQGAAEHRAASRAAEISRQRAIEQGDKNGEAINTALRELNIYFEDKAETEEQHQRDLELQREGRPQQTIIINNQPEQAPQIQQPRHLDPNNPMSWDSIKLKEGDKTYTVHYHVGQPTPRSVPSPGNGVVHTTYKDPNRVIVFINNDERINETKSADSVQTKTAPVEEVTALKRLENVCFAANGYKGELFDPGHYNYDEFEGIKTTFNESEPILFYYLLETKDEDVKIRRKAIIHEPSYQENSLNSGDKLMAHQRYIGSVDVTGRFDPGVYEVQWYTGEDGKEKMFGSTKVRITEDPDLWKKMRTDFFVTEGYVADRNKNKLRDRPDYANPDQQEFGVSNTIYFVANVWNGRGKDIVFEHNNTGWSSPVTNTTHAGLKMITNERLYKPGQLVAGQEYTSKLLIDGRVVGEKTYRIINQEEYNLSHAKRTEPASSSRLTPLIIDEVE